MNLLTIENVSKIYGEKQIFNKVSFGLNEGDKFGVIGINGTGKSTFLKITAGLEEPDEGKVTKGNKVRIGYLSQVPEFDETLTILENVVRGIESENEHWNLEGQATSMLLKLGLSEPDMITGKLSGGQKKRAALVRTLLNPSEILVLDEPTNHLDNEMTEWLEDYLNKYKGSIIMVTHDRYFLDKVTNKILEIDKAKFYTYNGNYTVFLTLKAEREEMELATERKKESMYRQDLEWMMRGARARSTKQKAHIQRFEELRDREKIVEDKNVEIESASARLGRKTIVIEHLCKGFGEKKLIEDFSYTMVKGERLGIVGHNGCGKSTLLKLITGNLEPDSGTIEIGTTVKIGYFSQENEYLDGELRVIDYIKNVAEYIEISTGRISASQMLERFLFTSDMQYSYISKLSGGEKRRLYLLKVLMEAPNVLILDEPTNDLDIQTLTILEHYLDRFEGIVITVSHDRYFLDRVVQRILAFEGNGKINQYEGGFTDYKENTTYVMPAVGNTPKKEKTSVKEKPKTKRLKFSYQEQKEFDEIDDVIAKLEEKLSELESQSEANANNYGKLRELMEEKDKVEELLDVKMERWVYLNNLNEQIEAEKNNR
ncbi:ABC-F family ATP-binding cassette domain-containing protein [[Clostridium] polysaccharolyticum]|uniref:ATP-binding cassette, subfamily F, uup n=1 Tax=[Clostridium] polysaccharolyticum TaxID=29364 RepID=A0A1H9YRG0_9FIRM|nr:ABC-F family ATP-binding cassette domain-containing protein [[Clostridium] polysaccharolyticum]SES71246.1 ATP-binding cassette, subfamily F, uup [[Clostridium] polysaccharolyticum]